LFPLQIGELGAAGPRERQAVSGPPDPRGVGGGVPARQDAHCTPAPAADRPFSLLGGGVEAGDTLAAALARELMGEVSIEAEILAFNRNVEAIAYEGERVRTHFVIASFLARWTSGDSA
jgi:ADP-ribose pyrophosphatase YjhB (NUDIX family)